ncbi:hypothetical protein CC85DRAFT_299352 [Cutaneotrichosporon oleaginosum]|uniref:Uncharacterized protein n=1 Tax=Cutaneotrichosporon oleaginosum TaxID=879819 RepID=A0A0J1BCF6_9TREE|nr:uncharacterized protein CC85DRAFT_299352 [Cutaneotrichosporon oleaginosum]KLT45704.1 hypothetical protein CC85DRAFT_299352 [Cutaneotrichosporon oleaginosum]TXT06195.1 hypothetical protein COLE_05526 [Cutaneotrichosporon oleaginosum]
MAPDLPDLPIPPCPRCDSKAWRHTATGIVCANEHALRPSLLVPRDAPKPTDFTWDGITGYAQVLHEPSLLQLRQHTNATMVHVILAHAAHTALAARHAALQDAHDALAAKHAGLIALYTDLVNAHRRLEGHVEALGGRVEALEGVQAGLFDVTVTVVPKVKVEGEGEGEDEEAA